MLFHYFTAAHFQRQQVDFDGAEVEDGSSGSDDDMEEGGEAPQAAAIDQQQQQQQQEEQHRQQPIVDADGFQLVQGRQRGRR